VRTIRDLLFHIETNRQFLEAVEKSISHAYDLPYEQQSILALNDLLERRQMLLMALNELHDSLYIEVREQYENESVVLDETA
jgi:hypothetical protein